VTPIPMSGLMTAARVDAGSRSGNVYRPLERYDMKIGRYGMAMTRSKDSGYAPCNKQQAKISYGRVGCGRSGVVLVVATVHQQHTIWPVSVCVCEEGRKRGTRGV